MKNNAATIIVKNDDVTTKYQIESDGIINVSLKNGSNLEELRVVGMNMMGDGIKAISKEGLIELPANVIKTIEDAGKGAFPAVEQTIIH